MTTLTKANLLTADEYAALEAFDHPTELVRGVIVHMPPPKSRHGQVCSKVDRIIGNYCESADIGHILCNDPGVITERDPDTVRGGDVVFYNYRRVPKGKLPEGYIGVQPDLVFEVRSPDDRWSQVLGKVTEYLTAGIPVVCVLDPKDETIRIYRDDQAEVVLDAGDEFSLPDVLGAFHCQVAKFFA